VGDIPWKRRKAWVCSEHMCSQGLPAASWFSERGVGSSALTMVSLLLSELVQRFSGLLYLVFISAPTCLFTLSELIVTIERELGLHLFPN
jgi:hypothetical protein